MGRNKGKLKHDLQAGRVPVFAKTINGRCIMGPCMRNPARILGQRYDQRIQELQEVFHFGDTEVFQRAEARLEEELRILEGAALCYRIYLQKLPEQDHDLLWNIIMLVACRQQPLHDLWPAWTMQLVHDLHLATTYKWLQNCQHLTDQICLDNHSLLCGRTRTDCLCAEIGALMPDRMLHEIWQRTIPTARASFPTFECVLIQRCHFGRGLLRKGKFIEEMEAEEEYMFPRLRTLLITSGYCRPIGELVVETRVGIWWTLPSTVANCVFLEESATGLGTGRPDKADPRATKSIHEISDEECMNSSALMFEIPIFVSHLRHAYSRHLWEVFHDVLASEELMQLRMKQCDSCHKSAIDLKACICGLQKYCSSDCQKRAWKSSHRTICPREPLGQKWMSSNEELLLRQCIGIRPDAVLNQCEKDALRVVGRQGEPWDNLRAQGRSAEHLQMLDPHISVEGRTGGSEHVRLLSFEGLCNAPLEKVSKRTEAKLFHQAWASEISSRF